MLEELLDAVHFDDSGAFLERPPVPPGTSLEHSDVSLSHSSSDNDRPAPLKLPTPPSFEAFLAMPREFMGEYAIHNATDTTLLLDVARLAIEMDAVVECTLEQLQDRAQLTRALTTGESVAASGSASLSTTLLVLLRQATMGNTQTIGAMVQQLQRCVDELAQIRYPLAQCIDSNFQSARELAPFDGSLSQSRHVLAEAERTLLERLDAVCSPNTSFRMTPLDVPQDTVSETMPQVCWPASSPFRRQDDVRLSSSASSSTPSQSSSALELASDTTQSVSLHLSTTPIPHAPSPTIRRPQGDSGSSSTTNGSSSTHNGGSDSSAGQHSQPRL